MNPHAAHSISPLQLWRSLSQHRHLILQMSKREIIGRYKGSMLGVLWSFLAPLAMLLIFTFVFGEIFGAKWPGMENSGGLDFAAALFVGLVLYTFFSECLSRAPSLVISNVNYVKKVVFPLEILAVIALLAALFHLLTAYVILVLLILFSGWTLSWPILLLPLILLPFMLMALGFTWWLSALGVYLRDIAQVIGPIMIAMLFLSPVFYSLDSVPQKLLWIYHLNPLTFVIEEARNLLLYANTPNWAGLALYSAISLPVFFLGYAFFQKTRKGFADVL